MKTKRKTWMVATSATMTERRTVRVPSGTNYQTARYINALDGARGNKPDRSGEGRPSTLFLVLIPRCSDNDSFDRRAFAHWQGAGRAVVRRTTSGPERGRWAKERGLRWGKTAPWVRCGACPRGRFSAIKWVIITAPWYKPLRSPSLTEIAKEKGAGLD